MVEEVTMALMKVTMTMAKVTFTCVDDMLYAISDTELCDIVGTRKTVPTGINLSLIRFRKKSENGPRYAFSSASAAIKEDSVVMKLLQR